MELENLKNKMQRILSGEVRPSPSLTLTLTLTLTVHVPPYPPCAPVLIPPWQEYNRDIDRAKTRRLKGALARMTRDAKVECVRNCNPNPNPNPNWMPRSSVSGTGGIKSCTTTPSASSTKRWA